MRHQKKNDKLNTGSQSHTNAIKRNLATSIILHERVTTTAKRAAVVSPIVEKLITMAKETDEMNAIRNLNQFLFDKNACRKVMEVLKDRYKDRTSGYTRITKFKSRAGDMAPMVIVELVN